MSRLILLAFVLLMLAIPRSSIAAPDIVLGSWPMYQGRGDHNAVLDATGWRYAWTATTGGRLNGGLAFSGTTLYAGSTDGTAYAFDARTGALRWRRAIGRPTMSAAILADGLVYFGTGMNDVLVDKRDRVVWGSSQGDEVIALDATYGWPVWRFPTIGEDMPSPVTVNVGGRTALVFSNGDDHVYALDAVTGAMLWRRDTFGVSTMSSLATDGSTVIGLFNLSQTYGDQTARNERLYRLRSRTWAIDARSARFRWTVPFGNSDCSPTFAAGTIFVESERRVNPAAGPHTPARNIVAALDPATGAMRWQYTSPGTGTFTTAGTNEEAIAGLYAEGTYFTSMPYPRAFAAFDPANGHVRWQITTSAPVKMSAIDVRGHILFGDTGGTLYAVDARTGHVSHRQTFKSVFDAAPPLAIGDTLYIPNGKRILALPLDRVL